MEKEFFKPRSEMYFWEKDFYGRMDVIYHPLLNEILSMDIKGSKDSDFRFVLTTDNFKMLLHKIAELEKRISELEQK